jgi:hypothetical protein
MGVHSFYCCGKLASVKLVYGAPDNTAGKPGKTNKSKCCRNEIKNFKIKDTHVGSSFVSLVNPNPVILPQITFIPLSVHDVSYNGIANYGNAPPGHPVIPVYTLNCAYRI